MVEDNGYAVAGLGQVLHKSGHRHADSYNISSEPRNAVLRDRQDTLDRLELQ